MQTITDQQLEQAAEVLGLPTGEHIKEQLEVFCEALQILDEREAVHKAAWQVDGHVDSAGHIRSKSLRVIRGTAPYEKGVAENVRDDAIDLLNYAAFWVRNVDADRLGEEFDPE